MKTRLRPLVLIATAVGDIPWALTVLLAPLGSFGAPLFIAAAVTLIAVSITSRDKVPVRWPHKALTASMVIALLTIARFAIVPAMMGADDEVLDLMEHGRQIGAMISFIDFLQFVHICANIVLSFICVHGLLTRGKKVE